MSDEYTPTASEIRLSWVFAVVNGSRLNDVSSRLEGAAEEFDRWLAAHDAEVKAAVLGSVATSIDLDAIANEWAGPDGSGHWSAGNAAAAVQLIIYDRAGREMRKAAPNE